MVWKSLKSIFTKRLDHVGKARAIVWSEPPAFALTDGPAVATDSDDLWLSYLCIDQTDCELYTLLRFSGVIDHRLSPINDEGLGQHPCAQAGLKFYEFHEISGSIETVKWATLQAKHWVITFKDNTLDVVACDCQVVSRGVAAKSALLAIVDHLASINEKEKR